MKRPSLTKAEIVLCVLALISIIPYALALLWGGIFAWLWIGYALLMMAGIVIFVLPNLLKQVQQERKQKK